MMIFQHKSLGTEVFVLMLVVWIAIPLLGQRSLANEKPSNVQGIEPRPLRQSQSKATQNTQKNQEKVKKASPFQVIFDEFLGLFKKKKDQAITRGTVCPIAPALLEEHNKIFSDRPLFMWKGNVDRLEIKNYWTDEILLSTPIVPGQTTWRYTGTPLQSGQIYLWTLRSGQDALTRELEIMSASERLQIQQRQALRTETSESPYFSQISDFISQGLWSDALVAFQDEADANGDSEIHDRLQFLAQDICVG